MKTSDIHGLIKTSGATPYIMTTLISVTHLMSSIITLGESMSNVAMYRGSCLFQLRRKSGVSGVGLSNIIVECSLSL